MAEAIEVRRRGGHWTVSEGGAVVAAFPRADLAERWASAARRLLAGEPILPAREEEPEPEPQPAGGDGAATWPEWGESWVWEPHEDADEEALSNALGESWSGAGAWVDEVYATLAKGAILAELKIS